MYTVNLKTGTSSRFPHYPDDYAPLAFDGATSTLYTYGFFNGNPTIQVASINLATGAPTPVATTDAVAFSFAGPAFDPVGHRMFFVANPTPLTAVLYTVNVQAGTFSRFPHYNDSYAPLAFDNSTGTLYAYGSFNGSSTVQVASINLATGAPTPVVTTDAVATPFLDSAFDPVGHRLFFIGVMPSSIGAVYIANLQTGTFSTVPHFVGLVGGLAYDPGVTSVPALSAWSLGSCGILLAVLAVWLLLTRAPSYSGAADS